MRKYKKRSSILILIIISFIVTIIYYLEKQSSHLQLRNDKTNLLDKPKVIKFLPGFELISARIYKVIDGDTAYFYTEKKGKIKVRFLWVNTEETKAYSRLRHSIWGEKAYQYTKKILYSGGSIFLETKGEKDNFGRILSVVWVDQIDLSYLLIANGYSPYYTEYGCAPGERHYLYLNAQDRAIKERKGIWGDKERREIYFKYILPKWNKGC